MRVLLINPNINLNKFGHFKRYMQPMPPIGLAYLAGMLKKNNIEFKVVDDCVEQRGTIGILDAIRRYSPDIVGISCLTPSAPNVFEIAKNIKACNKKIIIVLGNIHASIFSDTILKDNAADIIVHGEGESTFLEIVQAISEERNIEHIHGISFQRDGRIVKTAPRSLLENLDQLPYPAWEYFPYKSYGFLPFMDVKKPALSVLSSRGCIYKCSYCSLLYMNNSYRKRNSIKVVDEIEYLVGKFGVRQVGFIDPIFALYKNDGVDFCNEMIRRGLNKKVVWICETRIDCVDGNFLKLMQEAGCKRILYGIESGNAKTLTSINKHTLLTKIREAIFQTKISGIETTGLFMIGFPQEDEEMIKETISFAKSLDLDFAKFAITIPFPGSKLYDDLTREGKLKRTDWENFVTFNPDPKAAVSVSEKINHEKLIELQRMAHRKFYLRPGMVYKHLFKIRTITPADLFHSIGALFFHGK